MAKKMFGNLFHHKGTYSAVVYCLCAVFLLLLQNAPHGFPALFHVRPVIIVPFVVCVAALEGARAGAMMGTLCGFLWGLYTFRLFGMDALILLVLGLVAGMLVEWVLRANFLSGMILCAGGITAQLLLEWLFCNVLMGKAEVFTVLLRVYLPAALYTMLLSPLVYWGVLWLAKRIRRHVKD